MVSIACLQVMAPDFTHLGGLLDGSSAGTDGQKGDGGNVEEHVCEDVVRLMSQNGVEDCSEDVSEDVGEDRISKRFQGAGELLYTPRR